MIYDIFQFANFLSTIYQNIFPQIVDTFGKGFHNDTYNGLAKEPSVFITLSLTKYNLRLLSPLLIPISNKEPLTPTGTSGPCFYMS